MSERDKGRESDTKRLRDRQTGKDGEEGIGQK